MPSGDDKRMGGAPRARTPDRGPANGSGRPEYKVYRSGPRLFRRDRPGGDRAALDELRGRSGGDRSRPEYQLHRGGRPSPAPSPRRRPRVGRVLRYGVLAVLAWCLVSLVIFLVSAQIQSAQISDETRAALDPSGFTLTSPNNILILGSDARTEENAEPGSRVGGPSRADSIMLLRIGGGSNATLSIPRDTVVDIPGSGRNKINAAYAIGGAELAVTTVQQYLGIEVNHVVEVNFENFPALIDALGGIEVRTGCVVSRINGGYRNGGYTLRLKRGVNELDGDQALALARTRKNECNPEEDDRTRARRQQQIVAAIKAQVISLETFARLPWVSWQGPKAVRSDMAGPALLGVVGATVIGGDGNAAVLRPSRDVTLPDGGSALEVSEEEKQRRVERFLEG
jgi:LCP family protein required for cell wall assembly